MIEKIGKRFGKVVVIKKVIKNDKKYKYYWLCKCDCGNEKEIRNDCLKENKIISCGCYTKKIRAKNIIKATFKHGMSETKLYRIWADMKKRCLNKKVDRYKNYGGRGITICNEWLGFESFKDWALSNGYKEGLSIERINVNGNYEPSNCTWINFKEQSRNRTTNIFVIYNNKKICLAELSEITRIDSKVLYMRYNRGDREERLWRTPRISKVNTEVTNQIAKG